MEFLKTFVFTLSLILTVFPSTQGVDKYTDENRPYEFGFNIEGEQHRHEKKDEKGLIMGEFGFITADGVYHVTVYATDEEGRFKILSMKNIRVKPYPTSKQVSGRQGHSLEVAPPQQALQQTSTQKPGEAFKKITIEKPARSCSSCSLPTTTTLAPAIVHPNVPNVQNTGNFGQNPVQANRYPQDAKPNTFPNQPSFPANQNSYNNPQTYNQQNPRLPQQAANPQVLPVQDLVAPREDLPLYPPLDSPPNYQGGQINPSVAQSNPNQPGAPIYSAENPNNPHQTSFNPDTSSKPFGNSAARAPKRLDNVPQGFNSVGAQPNEIGLGQNQNQNIPKKPTLVSAQMQIVDKNTDIYKRGPGEKEGLPDGLTKNDMSQLLYTFNYTVGFHGHFEEGYRNGAKQGYYFVTGRNGVRTRVDYVADEKGFRPKITQEVLDFISEDVPKEETEKDEKYGLKGYEFKWLYFPEESKGQ